MVDTALNPMDRFVTTAEFATHIVNPSPAALQDITGVISLAGGVPVCAGSDLVGGIGGGGAPSGDRDEACANAGLAKFSEQIK